jgi:hypothetical protein
MRDNEYASTNGIDVQIQMSLLQRERHAKAWGKMPECPYLLIDQNGKLYCSFNYEERVSKLADRISPSIVNDIGADCGDREAFYNGEINEPCSPERCPNHLLKLR